MRSYTPCFPQCYRAGCNCQRKIFKRFAILKRQVFRGYPLPCFLHTPNCSYFLLNRLYLCHFLFCFSVPRQSFLPVDIPLFNSTVSVPFMHQVDWTTAVDECRFRGGYLPNTQAVDIWKTNLAAGFGPRPKIDSIASNHHMADATEHAQRKFVLCEIPKKYRDYGE